MEEIKKLLAQLQTEWASFKSENDRRIKEVEAKGHADPLTEEKISKHSIALGELQAQLDTVQKLAQRRGPGGEPQDEIAEAKAAHRKAFASFLRKGTEDNLVELQAKAMSVGSDPDGGFAVPSEIDGMIERYERENTPMREVSRVIVVSNENWEKLVSQGGAGTGWVDELEARPETTTPTLAAFKPFFGELYANPAATQKSLDDLGFDLEAFLAEEIGLEFAAAENAAFTSGNGIKKPKGILGYTLSTTADGSRALGELQKVVSGTSGSFIPGTLLDLVHTLQRNYRQNAVWMMSSLGVAAVRKLVDGASRYLFQPSFILGEPPTLLGHAIVENNDVADPAASSNSAIFGDFQRGYYITDVRGVRMLRDPYTNKPKVSFYTTKRTGGMVVNDRALKVYTLST